MRKKYQQIIAFSSGMVFVITLLVLAIFIPNPTGFQYLVFRVVLSIAAAGVAAMIPGFLSLQVSNWMRAGGALAVFVIVFFYNPASLVSKPSGSEVIDPLHPPIHDLTPQSKDSTSGGAPGATRLPVPTDEPDSKNEVGGESAASKAGDQAGLKIVQLLEGTSKDEAS